jgi:hypothetical protein
MFDRCPHTRIQVLTAMRRIKQYKGDIDLQHPPWWWTASWRADLRSYARGLIRKEWVEVRVQAATERWVANQVKEAVTAEQAAITTGNTERLADKAETMLGGNVGSGEEAQCLPAGMELDAATMQTVDFEDGTWRKDERHNQLKLRNLRKDKRSAMLAEALLKLDFVDSNSGTRRGDISLGGGVKDLLAKLKKVVEVEAMVAKKEAADQAEALDAMDGRGKRDKRPSARAAEAAV